MQAFKYSYGDFSTRHKTYEADELFGLELEVEALDQIAENAPDPWSVKIDDSLRFAAREYVVNNPVTAKQMPSAVTNLVLHLRANSKGLLEDSPRTSFHVHMNNRGLTPPQLLSFTVLYWLLEPVLTHFCGKKRKGNLFCLRLQDAEEQLTFLGSAVRTLNPLLSRGGLEYKYASMNLVPNARIGTVEFRCMAGDLKPERLIAWANTLNNIRTKAMGFDSPSDVVNWYYRSNKLGILKELFDPLVFDECMCFYSENDPYINEPILNTFAHSNNWGQVYEGFTKQIESAYIPHLKQRPRVLAVDEAFARMVNPVRVAPRPRHQPLPEDDN